LEETSGIYAIQLRRLKATLTGKPKQSRRGGAGQGKTIIGIGSADPSYSVALASDIAQAGGTYLASTGFSLVGARGERPACLFAER